MRSVETGLDVIRDDPSSHFSGQRTGLLTNPSGFDSQFRSAVDLLHVEPLCNLVALFGPEHGVRGEAQAGAHVNDARDVKTGLHVHSLYGATRKPTPAILEGLELMVVDVQDIGVRYATYLYTIALMLDACVEAGIEVMILDRPNPLGGVRISGNLLESGYESFVGVDRIPILHGLTPGEFACWYALEHGLTAPTVVPMRHWDASKDFASTGLAFVPPSPNLPTIDSVRLYPGTCLFEGTVLSEGRGTTRPFEMIGAPWIDPDVLAGEMNAHGHPGVWCRAVWFTPTFSKHQGEQCGGVFIHVTDPDSLDAIGLGMDLLGTIAKTWPEHFAWLPPPKDRWFIDLLTGTAKVRTTIDAGNNVRDLRASWKPEADAFRQQAQTFWLYDRPDSRNSR